MTEPEKESEKQQGISKEAWTAISAIAVALIGGIVTIFVTIYGKSPPSPSPSNAYETLLIIFNLLASNQILYLQVFPKILLI
jgi:hypothetical protein